MTDHTELRQTALVAAMFCVALLLAISLVRIQLDATTTETPTTQPAITETINQ